MNHLDYDISDRCKLCQVKSVYHTLQFGEPSEVVVSAINKDKLNISYDHEFVRMDDTADCN